MISKLLALVFLSSLGLAEDHPNKQLGDFLNSKVSTLKTEAINQLVKMGVTPSKGEIEIINGMNSCLAVSTSFQGDEVSGVCAVNFKVDGESRLRHFGVSVTWPGSISMTYLGDEETPEGLRNLPPNIELSNYVYFHFAYLEATAQKILDAKRGGPTKMKLNPSPFSPFYCVSTSMSLDSKSASGVCLVDASVEGEPAGSFFSVTIAHPGVDDAQFSMILIDDGI